MEKDRGDKKASKRYYFPTPAQLRPLSVKNGASEIEGRGGAAEIGLEQSTQGVTQAKYSHE